MRVPPFARFLAFGLLLATGCASAQTYPDKSRPIRVIVPFAAGTSADLFARAIARGMADVGITAVVDNRPGGESIIGVQAVKQAQPDGYTMLLTSLTTQVVNPHVLPNLPYNPIVDFTPLVGVAKTPLHFVVNPASPYKTVGEFVAAARANPGKLTYGAGTMTIQLAGEMLMQKAGINLLMVPYKNPTDAGTSLGSNQLDMIIYDPFTASTVIQRGARALAQTGAVRSNKFPDMPTMQEAGVKDYELDAWFATYVSSKTPPAVVTALREIVRNATKAKYLMDILNNFAMEPFDVDVEAYQKADYERWGKTVRSAMPDAKK